MNSNHPQDPRSQFSTAPLGILFGTAALIWAAALIFINVRSSPHTTHTQLQSPISASTLMPNIEPTVTETREAHKPSEHAVPDTHKEAVHSAPTSDPLKNPQCSVTIHWDVAASDSDLSPLSKPEDHTPVTIKLQTCREAAGRYRWFFFAVNRSHSPWLGKIRVFLLGHNKIVHVEDFTIETPLEPEENVATDYGVSLHAFETDVAPQIKGGPITGYGYSVVTDNSSE